MFYSHGDGTFRRTTDLRAQVREYHYESWLINQLQEGVDLQTARDVVSAAERDQRLLDDHNPGGALRIASDPRTVHFSVQGEAKCTSGDIIVLATDGFMRMIDLY